jgi:hypothetical protein
MIGLYRFKRNDDETPLDLSSDDLRRRFTSWMKTRDEKWLDTTKSDTIIMRFIESFDGLDASITSEQEYKVISLLKPLAYEAKYSER